VLGKTPSTGFCFALFTLVVAAGNRGFLAIGDWLKAYHIDLVALFNRIKGAYRHIARLDGHFYGQNIKPMQLV
jgi:hypothetical protein